MGLPTKGDAVTYVGLVLSAALLVLDPIRRDLAMMSDPVAIWVSKVWTYTPAALLLLVGVIWLFKILRPKKPDRPGTGAIKPQAEWDQPLEKRFRVHYKNETVDLDGFEFIECVFDNVTFRYQGTKPSRFHKSKGNSVKLTTDNPVVADPV